MNRKCLLFITLLSLYFVIASGKPPREHRISSKYRAVKKVSSKPTKSTKSVADAFKDLPADDKEFIRQLDQKYKQFGNGLKIKIQKDNRTRTTNTKNSKRTIDGSLGYGYYSNQQQENSYQFSKPKFQIYPYSQHDIAPARDYLYRQLYTQHSPQALENGSPQNYYEPHHIRTHTSVEVQPSRSYEIKETEHGYTTIFNGGVGGADEQQQTAEYHNPHGDDQAQAVPVIVLRVPGAGKYAAHLQALLQQYLEVRAAQYLQALQEQEAQAHSGVDVAQQPEVYHQQQTNVQTYPAVVQQEYTQTHTSDETAHISEADEYHASEGTEHDDGASGYDYGKPEQQEQLVYTAETHESSSEHNLLTTENFPDSRHTQVIFKSTTETPISHYTGDHSPQVQVQTYRAPLVYHQFEQFYGNPGGYSQEEESSSLGHQHGYENHQSSAVPQNYVTITQRPALPYNYHANIQQQQQQQQQQTYSSHYSGEIDNVEQGYLPPQTNNLYKRSYSSRYSSSKQPTTEDRYKKFTNLMHRFKARMASPKQGETQ